MKLLAVYLSIFLFATFGILPVMLYAGEKEIDGKPVRILYYRIYSRHTFQDSIPVRRGSDKKEQDRPAADTRTRWKQTG
jgi:hypothetical protein